MTSKTHFLDPKPSRKGMKIQAKNTKLFIHEQDHEEPLNPYMN